MILIDVEMPSRCAECAFATNPEEFGIIEMPGCYVKISKCLLAPEEIEDPWRTLLWQSKNKEEWCPLKEVKPCGNNYFCLPKDAKGKAYLR